MTNPGKVDLEPAYVLHSRSYRETSELLEVFSAGYGRIGLVARGARRPKSAFRGLLAPFQALRMSWSGRGELATLRAVDTAGAAAVFDSERIMAGFYVNELLLKLLHRHDAHGELFLHYGSLLTGLGEGAAIEPLLRGFELELLREIGYAVNLDHDVIHHEPLQPEQWYEFRLDQGPVPIDGRHPESLCFTGAELLAIDRREFEAPEQLKAAKRLLRASLNFHLGERGLHTRKVAAAMRR